MSVLILMELMGLMITYDCRVYLQELSHEKQYFKIFKIILVLNLPILMMLSKLYRDFNLI